ncbi:uncharacterized protein LOC134770242 [Penaeus indicus]|uniref:uncharacterized protein LOC134770242 n=1 Tax=Penaeus indicus TaxID=29960 RepID=UPI00300CA897
MSSENLHGDGTGVDKNKGEREFMVQMDALRNEVTKINANLNTLFATVAELRDEMSVEKGKRVEFEDKYQYLLSEMTALRIGFWSESDPLVPSPPARHERTVPQTTVTQSSQSIPLVTHSSTLRSKGNQILNVKHPSGYINLHTRQAKQYQHIASSKTEDLQTFVDAESESLPEDEKFGPSAIEAYIELCSRSYSLDEDPYEFVNKFRARFRAIARAFPHEQRPKEEETWKRVMMENLPESIKSRLQICTIDGMGAAFLSELGKERSYLRSQVNRADVRETFKPEGIAVSYPCGWCQNGSRHIRSKCPRNPAARSCFDCLAQGKRKGHSGCPGKTDTR